MIQGQAFAPTSLTVEGLAAGRGETELLHGLSFEVAAGTGLLLRGPNGVGKSTLLLTLAGLLTPLEGSISTIGPEEDDGPSLHYCGHRNAVRPRLTVQQTLDFWAGLNGRTGIGVNAALNRVGLGPMARLDAGYLSAGQGRRLALARLLVSRRPIWLLDEPSAALDADGRALLTELLGEHLAQGGLFVIATHDDIDLPGLSTLTLGNSA
jgi:heme exporter protein A